MAGKGKSGGRTGNKGGSSSIGTAYARLLNGETVEYKGFDGVTYAATYDQSGPVNFLDVRRPGASRSLRQPTMTREELINFANGLGV